MKKFLLSLGVVVFCTAAVQADEWSIVGTFNDWNEMEGIALEEQADGLFTGDISGLKGEFKFVKNHSWSGCLGSAMIADITGNGTFHVASPGKSNLNIVESSEEATVTLDPENKVVTFAGFPTDMDTSIENTPQYKEGAYWCITDPQFGFYNEARGMQSIGDNMYMTANVYLGKDNCLAFSKAVIEFPVGYDRPEDVRPMLKDYLIGSTEANAEGICKVTPTYSGTITCPAEVETFWQIEEAGYYNIVVDYNAMTLIFEKIDLNDGQWSVIGSFTNWADDVDMRFNDNGKWEVSLPNFKGEFKFYFNHAWDINLGNDDEYMNAVNIADGTYNCFLSGGNFNLAEEVETLNIVLDVNASKVTFEKVSTSGVKSIDTDTEEPIYFNLQGVRVSNPENGVFIRYTVNKVEKVIR